MYGTIISGLRHRHNFFHPKTQKHTFPARKSTFGGLPGIALSRGRDIPRHSRKNTVSNTVSFPPLNNSPSVLAVLMVVVLVVVLLSHVVVVVFVYFVAALPTPLLPPPSARRCHHHRRWSARRMTPATGTPTAAPPRWRKLSARHWNLTRRWTGPFRPVTWAAKTAMMMAALMVAAK